MDRIVTLHRKHLRNILYIKGTISNKALYKRCNLEMLSKRWKMVGHIIRSTDNTPAQMALSFAI